MLFSSSVYFILSIYFFGMAFAFATLNETLRSVTYPEMNMSMSRNDFVVVTVTQVEPTSTST